ncbi:lipoate--protein ligase [Caproiciproducens sp. NJN-50]|uniref:lipoate--protein ligase n=1 Tax=Acutalibacteraceae TaxID=3082771 RepID=UPI000FFE03B2|nr:MULTISPECIES: lipoate--protein ligase [Acutalibacteraceae]QAT49162.1 lipoate--protein ligase [Caproiciproducens sp. NJN-50]
MIEKALICTTENLIPYRNLALEEYLMDTVPEKTCILYLWRNQNTVVIGRNQNCWKECRVKELEADGGHLVRRLSGGGAVFHDLGNLNFTFLVRKSDYDVSRQLDVILHAVSACGIHAEKSGRNDVTVDGRKFSGNAFYFSGQSAYHHGTILIDVDKEKAGKYLSVSAEKIRSKGVDSVRSRIANLNEFSPGLTVDRMERELCEAFGRVYGIKPELLPAESVDASRVEELRRKFADPAWIYGQNIPFNCEFSSRFDWGGVEIGLQVRGGLIAASQVDSDAMDEEFIRRVAPCLTGCPFSSEVAAKRLQAEFAADSEERQQYAQDIERLLYEQQF